MRRLTTVFALAALVLGGVATGAAARPAPAHRPHGYGISRDAQGIVHISAPSLDARAAAQRLGARARPALPDGRHPPLRLRHPGRAARQAGRWPRTSRPAPSGCAAPPNAPGPLRRGDLRAALQAYADGVNDYVRHHPLPPEYAALHLTTVAPWTPVDSLVVGKALSFELSFDNDIPATLQLQAYVAELGPGAGVRAVQPGRDALAAVQRRGRPCRTRARRRRSRTAARPRVDTARLAEAARLGRCLPEEDRRDAAARRPPAGRHAGLERVGGRRMRTTTGRPIVANDPHLSLGEPSTFYPIALRAPGLDVAGEGFAGAPGVIIGHNRDIAWGATDQPDGRHRHLPGEGRPGRDLAERAVDHLPRPPRARPRRPGDVPLQQRRHARSRATAADGVPAATLIVPRRNNGPIVQLDLAHQAGLSIQYTGFSATFELETFLRWDRARNLARLPRRAAATSTSARRTGPTPTGTATSPTSPARRCRCARTCRPAPSTACRRGSSATGRAATSGCRCSTRSRARRSRTRSTRPPRCRTSSTRRPGGSSTPTTTRPAPSSTTTRSTSCGPAAASTTSTPATTGSAPAGSPR